MSVVAGALLLVTLTLTGAATVGAATNGAVDTFIVLYSQGVSMLGAQAAVQKAGGSVVATYGAIGVLVATSSDSNFGSTMSSVAGVEGVSATSKFATTLNDDQVSASDASARLREPAKHAFV